MWIFTSLAVGFLTILVVYLYKSYNFWRKKGIPCPTPKPFVGNMGNTVTMVQRRNDIILDIYKKFKGYRYVGFYNFMEPIVLIRDPELVKDILVKEFNSFNSNGFELDPNADPLMGRNPFALSGDKWKVVRGQLTPNFSSGKMRGIFPLLEEVSRKFVQHVETLVKTRKAVECKNLCLKLTTENVASCAFGLEAHAFSDENSQFVKVSQSLGNVSFIAAIEFILVSVCPILSKFIPVRFFSAEATEYLLGIVNQTLKYRSDNKIVRNDFLDMMSLLKEKSVEYEFTNLDVAAHAAGFFGDGVITSANVFSYTLYAIAYNTEVQIKLRKEIDTVLANNKDEITYDGVQEMVYLDCVINESLRKYAPLGMLTKKCTKSYKLPGVNENGTGAEFLIEKGMSIAISVDGLHYDEKYYENPEKFDPDRFSNENKSKLHKCTFLPFGEGPRVCLGIKFGVLQIKIGIISLLSKFEIKINEKTKDPLVNDTKNFFRVPVGGLWIDIITRKKL